MGSLHAAGRHLIDRLEQVPVIDAIPDVPLLVCIAEDDLGVQEHLRVIEEALEDNLCGPEALLSRLAEHNLLVAVDVNRHAELYNDSMHTAEQIEAEV